MPRTAFFARGGHGRRRGLLLAAALGLCLAAALWLAGCAGGYLDPGPSPARVRVKLRAKAPEPSHRFQAGTLEVMWDWGLYLVREEGGLAALRPADGQRLRVIRVNPLERDTVFLVPPGKRRFRLLVEAYYFKPHAESFFPISLGGVVKDFDLEVAPGREAVLEVTYPQP